MSPKDRPEQLDIPLVWEQDGGADETAEPRRSPGRPARPAAGCGTFRLGAAALADLGFTLAGVAGVGAVALLAGAELVPVQMAGGALVGLELATVVGAAVLWGWRATPGMMVLNARFDTRLPLGRAVACWLAWMAVLPVAALPLLLGRRGRRPVERLAGGSLSCRPPTSAA